VPDHQVPTRERILAAGEELFRRQGYAGTGVKAILAAGQAPYGSLYHFFPGGKEELGVAALRAGGATYRELVEVMYPPGADVVAATRAFFEGAAELVEATGYADACPIATVALEVASTSEPMRRAAADAFESWLAVLVERFVAAGIEERRARELAVELFCAIEGAFLLSRTTRTTEALAVAGRAAADAVARALALTKDARRGCISAAGSEHCP
jgi:TetR/AcrR family transcriptional repressor of lmrAB and yxaGH operons